MLIKNSNKLRSLNTLSTNQKDVVGTGESKILKLKYKKIKNIWYDNKNTTYKNDILKINYYQNSNFFDFISVNSIVPFDKKINFHYEFMEFYYYINDYYSINIFENTNLDFFLKNTSLKDISLLFLQTLLIPFTTFFNLNIDNKKKNIFFIYDFTNKNIFYSLDTSILGFPLDKEDKVKILNYFCHYISNNLPFFWFLDKNNYLKEVCFFSTGTYFNSIGKNQKITINDKKKFFGSFLRNEVLDLVIDKYWQKSLIFFLRKNFFSNKIYSNNTNIINYTYVLLYKFYFIEINKLPTITSGVYNLFVFLSKNQNTIISLINKTKNKTHNNLLFSLISFVNKHSTLFSDNNNIYNLSNFNNFFYTLIFKEHHKLFYFFSLKKYSLEELPSIFPFLKNNKLIPSNTSNTFKNFFLYENEIKNFSPTFFNINLKNNIVNKTVFSFENYYEDNPVLLAFQDYNLKGIEVNKFKLFFKNYFLSNQAEKWIIKFEKLFNFLKIKFFTSHFSEHLPKKKKNVFDSIITFHKWKIFVKKKMPYFFDGPWMSVSKNKIGRYWICYIVNNISDYWFLKNKQYLNDLHFSLMGYNFPSKKKITVKTLRIFYASYIYTISKYKLKNCVIYNPYVKLLNKFYLSPIVPFYLVNTEDNFGRFFEEYYFGHNKQLLYTLTSLIRQEFAIPNSFLLKTLRFYSDELKYQNKNFLSDDEDLKWDLNFSGYNSLYSGRSSTNGLHIFISYLYEDFFRNLVNLDKNAVPVQEKCKSDSLFFHTFNWDKLEPLD